MIVPTLELLKRSLNVLKAASPGGAGPLDGCIVMLFQNNAVPTVDTVLADLTEATYTGYARTAAVVWGAAHIEGGNQWVSTGDLKEIDCTGSGAGQQTIYGYGLLSTDSPPVLLAAELFAPPVQVAGAGDTVLVLPQYGQQMGT